MSPNFWSHALSVENFRALKQLLLSHPYPAYQNAGVFNANTNKSGWIIYENGDSGLLGLQYIFKLQWSDFDSQDQNFNVTTNILISFSSNPWKLKYLLLPDPRNKLASVLYLASDNIFDRLVDLKPLFVSGLIFRFPFKIKQM